VTTQTVTDDIVKTDSVAITFGPDDMFTISAGVLVESESRNAVFGSDDNARLINNGNILSGSAAQSAVFFNGGNPFVSNAAGARIVGAGDAIGTNSGSATVDNAGILEGLGGVGVVFIGADGQLTNSGSIYGRVHGVQWEGRDGTIGNSGLITANDVGVFINTALDATTTITNTVTGTITGLGNAFTAVAGRVSFINAGQVIGAVLMVQEVAENDVIVNQGRISGTVFLGGGNDLFRGVGGTSGAIFGGSGDDRLIGGAVADRLHGGAGADTLSGGGGRDQFFFDTDIGPAFGVDRITDFASGIDKVILADVLFDRAGPDGPLAAARFHIGPAAADAGDRIIYNANTGFLFYDRDGIGAAPQVHFATLAPHLLLHSSDFLVAHLLLT
jgi:Ca2+-binding RTX toxin-like protein